MTTEFKKMKFTKQQLGIPDDGDVHLHDLTFDFEDYFDRHGTDAMDDEESKEFSARVMGLFCKDFWESGGNPAAIQPWVANYIAKAFYEVLGGVPFRDVLPTPMEPQESWLTAKGLRAMDVYSYSKGTKDDATTLSARHMELAEKHSLTYESIRGDYYKMKGVIEEGKPWPKGFLKTKPKN
jgi:hypothetical protein